jgi:hypothetical protein
MGEDVTSRDATMVGTDEGDETTMGDEDEGATMVDTSDWLHGA